MGITSEDAFSGHSSYQNGSFAVQRKAGVRLIRQKFDWAQIETRPSVYDWSSYDALVLSAARNGLLVLPILFNPPAWHSSGPVGGRFTYPPRDPATMAAFAAAAVMRYGPSGSLWAENPGVPRRAIRTWQIGTSPASAPTGGDGPTRAPT